MASGIIMYCIWGIIIPYSGYWNVGVGGWADLVDSVRFGLLLYNLGIGWVGREVGLLGGDGG
jgi:exonuclease I